MSDDVTTIAALRKAVAAFVAERDWEQFHGPKNLAMSIAIEAAELMEHFQWTDGAASSLRATEMARREAIAEEMADVLAYLLSLANSLEVDLSEAFEAKMRKNAVKYPPGQFQGKFEM